MTRYLRGSVVSLAVLLALCAPARAAPFTPGLERAYNVAVQFWGVEPTNCLTLDREIVDDGTMQGDEGLATIATQPTGCILYVRRYLARPSMWVRACGVLVHEIGHLLGYEHSTDPSNVMYPTMGAVPRLCFRAGLRELLNRPAT